MRPCSMMAYDSGPRPVPMKMSWMSRRRQSLPFSRYSLSPERNRRRVTAISPALKVRLNLRRRILSTTCCGARSAAGGSVLRHALRRIEALLRRRSGRDELLRCSARHRRRLAARSGRLVPVVSGMSS